MNTTAHSLVECVELLVHAFPVEDIWYLEAGKAKECHLEQKDNLIVIVSNDVEAHKIEEAAYKLMADEFGESDVSISVFSLDTMTRIPRPQIIKMAFTAGKNIYCK